MRLRITRIAAGSALQDDGRRGYRNFGVPRGGAFDRESALLANSLLGNPPFAPLLELPLMGIAFTCDCPTNFAVVGGSCQVDVEGRRLSSPIRFAAQGASTVSVGPVESGARTYLAVEGGFTGDVLLGSVSGWAVKSGDVLEIRASSPRRQARLAEEPSSVLKPCLRFVLGPQSPMFDLEEFARKEFVVSHDSDRKGIRLKGAVGEGAAEIVSEPAGLGSIQITPDGTPIVLGVDGPTIGGYPKIGVVISADCSALGQLRPGNHLTFERVSFDEARDCWLMEQARLTKLSSRLVLA